MRELKARVAGLVPGDPITPSARLVSMLEPTVAFDADPPVFVQHLHSVDEAECAADPLYLKKLSHAGQRPFPPGYGLICRSEFKLLEAIDLFGIPTPAGTMAVDLGASPGGWTRVVRMRGMLVTAVDPAALDIRIESDPGVRHLRTTAGQYLKSAASGSISLLLNDMKMEFERSCALMVDAAPLMTPDGWAVLTLKLPANAVASWPGIIKRARELLEGSYTIVGIRQLLHNRSEVTCALRFR